ncbi:MAG: CGNR zinc finger domain-containing protein [Rhizobiales bacterium]|nr:CGNR zinc finger domain-containing protein [Hyphomicrobiales bacterium]
MQEVPLKQSPTGSPWPHRFVGGALCLDFINSIDVPGTAREQDLFVDYQAILRWSLARGSLNQAVYDRLAAMALASPAAAETVWREALALRADIRALTGALRRADNPAPLLSPLNERLSRLPAAPALRHAGKAGRIAFDLPGKRLDEPLWPVLWTAAALFVSDDTEKLGECQASDCDAIFIDHTNNRSRIWCATETCGNRERVRRAYQAKRAARQKMA